MSVILGLPVSQMAMGPEDEPLLSGSLSDSQSLSRAGATVSVDPEQAASVTEATVDNGMLKSRNPYMVITSRTFCYVSCL